VLQKVVRSTVIDAPLERVWAVLRDFNSHNKWHDAVQASHIEGNERSDQVGCIRNFTLTDGNRIREQLLTLSDSTHTSTYCIVQATVPLQRYVATLKLKPVTDGNRTFWHWESTFDTPPGQEQALRDMVAHGVYETGFENLRQYLRQGTDFRQNSESSGAPVGIGVASRSMAVQRYGDAAMLRAQDTQVAAPGPGQVRIAQRAIGVNFIDVYLRRGWIPHMLPVSVSAPGVLGMEAAGTVIDTGPQVTGLLPGDRVAYIGPQPGAYCTVRCVPADWVVRLPVQIEIDAAAALLLKGITADYLLRDLGRVGPGTRLLVHAAAGGVGLLVCSWAKRLGAQVLGTVSSEEKARVAREHGCDHVVVTREYRFADVVQRACGGADVVIDGLGDAARDENFAALARLGHWISLGQATGPMTPMPADMLVSKSLTFSRPVVFDYVANNAELTRRAQRVWDALESGAIKLPPIERYALEAAAQVHARLESRGTMGALILIT
jgi:NADPH:quinone reductase